VVEQRLEHGKIAEVLVAEAVLELADFLGHVGLALETLHHGAADFPIQISIFALSGKSIMPSVNMCCASSLRSCAS
jgi:hypothetical protein